MLRKGVECMKFFQIDENKRKKAYKFFVKRMIKNQGFFVKFSFVFEKILIIISISLSLADIINIVLVSHDLLDLLLLSIDAIPWEISLIFRAVYREWTLKEYKYRGNEKIGIENSSIQYSYTSPMSNIDEVFLIDFESIYDVEYFKDIYQIVIYGTIEQKNVVQKEIIDSKTVDKISFLNIFKRDIIEVLKQNNIKIKEI